MSGESFTKSVAYQVQSLMPVHRLKVAVIISAYFARVLERGKSTAIDSIHPKLARAVGPALAD